METVRDQSATQTTIDVTENVNLGELREREARNVLILVLDENGGIINSVIDPQIQELLLFDGSNQNLYDFLFSSLVLTQEDKLTLWQEFQADGNKEHDIDFSASDGLRHLHFSCYRVDGERTFFLIIDETELTLLKRSLEAERTRLENANRHYMEDIRLISQGIKTSLATADSFAASLLRTSRNGGILEGVLDEKIVQWLKIVALSVKDALDLLTSILRAEEIAHGAVFLKKEQVDMYDIIKEVLESLEIREALAEKKVAIDYKDSFQDGQVVLEADKRMCKILWRNLIDNALSRMPPRGRLTFGAIDRENNFDINLYNEGEVIPETTIGKVFNQEFQGSPGFRLFLSKLIVELHGGKIWAEKNRTEGVNIVFQLPKK